MTTPTILIVGDLRAHTRTQQRLQALRELGLTVVGLSTTALDGATPGRERFSLLDRVRHRLRRPRDRERAGPQLLARLRAQAFDLVWIEKAPCIRPAVLSAARALRPEARFVFLSEDDMARAHNQTAWFTSTLPHYDLVVTTKSGNETDLPPLGARRVRFTYKSFDPRFHRPVELLAGDRERLGAAVGFVGTFEEPRARSIHALAEAGVEVRVFGPGWGDWTDRHPRMRVENRVVWGEEYVRTICATDINLGFLRRANADQHTDRSVEIPACGAFLLAERSDEHRALLAEGREADFFGDPAELEEKVKRWLAQPGERRRAGAAARERMHRDGREHAATLRSILADVGFDAPAASRAEEVPV